MSSLRTDPLRAAGSGALRLALAALVLTLTFAIGSFVLPSGQAAAGPITPNTDVVDRTSFADVIEAVQPAVVNISVAGHRQLPGMEQLPMPFANPAPSQETPFDDFFRRFFGAPNSQAPEGGQEFAGMGSGFLIDPGGYVVTNQHVIDGAEQIVVTLNNGDRFDGTLVGSDDKTDLALVRIKGDKPFPYVQFGDSEQMRPGDWVVAIGNPFGFGGSATAGIISARGRDLQAGPFDDFLQIDAPINRGNSGGPLFDLTGRVIGINSAIYSPNGGNVGIGFAIPAEMAEPVLTDLRDKGQVERGWLGVTVQGLDDDLAKGLDLDNADGALVADVVDGSPAQAAGVQSGDVIVAIAGEPVDSPKTLARRVADADPNEAVQLKVWRNGESITLAAKLGDGSEAAAAPEAAQHATGDHSEHHLGLALRALSDQARRNLRLSPDVSGVLIAGIEPGSEAARRGLQPGDVLLRVGTTPVTDPAQARDAIDAAAKADRGSIVLQVLRNGSSRFLALDLS